MNTINIFLLRAMLAIGSLLLFPSQVEAQT